VTSNVCVGQVHLGSGGSSTKPLLELYYHSDGNIYAGTENSPSGGQTLHYITHVALGVQWTYVLNVTDYTINLTVNGIRSSYGVPSSFDAYGQYFKAGDYNQSSSNSTSNGAKVKFYSLSVN
jgi:Alginate lyase